MQNKFFFCIFCMHRKLVFLDNHVQLHKQTHKDVIVKENHSLMSLMCKPNSTCMRGSDHARL